MSRYMREVSSWRYVGFFFFQAEDGIRDADVTAVQTCALPICYGYYGSRSFSVPLTATVDYGATDEFSFGGFIGYYGTSYGPKGNRYGFRNFSFGAQGTFHATAIMNEAFDMDIDEKKVDYYVRLMLGYETFSWTYNGKSYSDFYYDNQTSGRLVFAPVLGVRYMFNPNLGVYVEGGRGTYGYLTLGLSVKF